MELDNQSWINNFENAFCRCAIARRIYKIPNHVTNYLWSKEQELIDHGESGRRHVSKTIFSYILY